MLSAPTPNLNLEIYFHLQQVAAEFQSTPNDKNLKSLYHALFLEQMGFIEEASISYEELKHPIAKLRLQSLKINSAARRLPTEPFYLIDSPGGKKNKVRPCINYVKDPYALLQYIAYHYENNNNNLLSRLEIIANFKISMHRIDLLLFFLQGKNCIKKSIHKKKIVCKITPEGVAELQKRQKALFTTDESQSAIETVLRPQVPSLAYSWVNSQEIGLVPFKVAEQSVASVPSKMSLSFILN